MLTLFAIPSSSDIWASVSAYSGDTFLQFLPILLIVLGLAVGALGAVYIMKVGLRTAKTVLGKGKGGGRRRGRR